MDKCKIVLAGAYGIQNAGDDAPMIVIKESFERLFDSAVEFVVLARHVLDFDKSMFCSEIIKNIEYDSRKAAYGKWFNGLNFGDDKREIETIKDQIRDSNLLVIGAGNAFIDISIDVFRGPIPLMAVYCFLADMYDVPIVFYGVSVGPIKSNWGKDLSRWMLKKATLVSVRDLYSIKYIEQDLGVQINPLKLPDPVLGLMSRPLSSPQLGQDFFDLTQKDRKIIIGVGLREIRSVVGADERDRVFREIVDFFRMYEHLYAPIFIPNSTYPDDDDREMAAELVSAMDGVSYLVLNERFHPSEIISIYSKCDCSLSIRLHSAVFSILAGVPVLAISYLPKVSGFIANLKYSASSLEIESVSQERIHTAIQLLLEERKKGRNEVIEFLSEAKLSLDEFFQLMLKLLS